MIALLLGGLCLVVLMAALGMFSRAQVATIKQFGVWIVAIGGLLLTALLFLTGRGPSALAALAMLGPLVWSWMGRSGVQPGVGPRASAGGSRPGPRPRGGMSRDEALEVLGLKPGASREDIHAAYIRLMRAAHPDRGGSDWLASRINQARDVLLG